MAVLTFTARSGASLTAAGSPYEMEDPAGFYGFGFSTNDDWYSIGDSKSSIDERPVADGAFGIIRDWRPGLPLSFQGWYRAKDRASLRAARRRFQSIVANGRSVNVTFADEDESTTRAVSVRNARPSGGSGLYFTWTIDAVALDPNAYGATVILGPVAPPASGGGLWFPLGTRRSDGVVDTTVPYWDFGADGTSGRVSVTNNGTTDTYPTIVVTGGLAGGFIVTDITTGEVVRVDRQIPIGSTVVINQKTGSAIIDGSGDISGFITSYGFFSIGPGETHVIQWAPIGATDGTPTMTLQTADANL